jgi:ABC-type multidrug transport system permease subunit
MRWLLLKDLQILRRSPLVTVLLVLYPAVIAVLIGFALSRGPEKPRVAFLNLVPRHTPFEIGNEHINIVGARNELCGRIECVRVNSVAAARKKVKDGDVLGALILPRDLVDKLESLASLNPEQPTVQVLVNEENPVKGRLVNDRITSLLGEANLRISRQVSGVALNYLDLLLRGGRFSLLGQTLDVLGLTRAERILEAVLPELPKHGGERQAVQQVITFSQLARQNLDLAAPLLSSVSEPIKVDKEVVSGRSPPLDTFAISVAATFTLMFVTVLLVAGSLALERDENAFARLTRGLVSRVGLLAEKVVLGAVCALAVTLLMLAVMTFFVPLEWSRSPLFVPAIVVAGVGFSAMGAAIGGAAREVRASALLAFMISLPIAFLALVPSGSVSPTLFDVIKVANAMFPFRASLDAMSGALHSAGPDVGRPLVHLAILTLAYGALARLSLRRFA